MSIIVDVFANTFNYSGRARRKEYWFFALFQLLIGGVLLAVDFNLGWFDLDFGLGPLSGGFLMLTFPTCLAVTVRRFHDSDKSGWWYLIGLIPLVGPFILVTFMAIDGTHGANEYGLDPLGRESKSSDAA